MDSMKMESDYHDSEEPKMIKGKNNTNWLYFLHKT